MTETAREILHLPKSIPQPSTERTRRLARENYRRLHRASVTARHRVQERTQNQEELSGVHPVLFLAALAATLWFLVSVSLTFATGGESSFLIAVVVAVSVISFLVVALTASLTAADPRWRTRHVTFLHYLRGRASIATGSLRGWQAALQILVLPVSLALAMTAFGLVWVLVS